MSSTFGIFSRLGMWGPCGLGVVSRRLRLEAHYWGAKAWVLLPHATWVLCSDKNFECVVMFREIWLIRSHHWFIDFEWHFLSVCRTSLPTAPGWMEALLEMMRPVERFCRPLCWSCLAVSAVLAILAAKERGWKRRDLWRVAIRFASCLRQTVWSLLFTRQAWAAKPATAA